MTAGEPHLRPSAPASSPTSDQTMQEPKWIVLAHLLRPQGRKGEILAELLTDFPERFASNARVFLAPQNFRGAESEARTAEVSDFWLPVGRNSGRIVLHFAGVDLIEQAEKLAGLDVVVPVSERLELDADTSYVSDLIGCTVYDHADPEVTVIVGNVTDVSFPMSPDGMRRLEEAPALLMICGPLEEEILVPFAKAFLINVDVGARRIDMKLPPGLVDVNRPDGRSA